MFKTVSEISRKYGQSESTIRKWIKEGKLKAYKPSSRTLIKPEEFEAFIESCRIRAAQDTDAMSFLKEFCA
jgi:excisionase family DNA binding protein